MSAFGKLLIVDDEEAFVSTISKRLIKREYNVVTALSGIEALKRLENDNDIEVVVLDVKMPGIDGIETLQKIKRKYPLIEVIMLTGHATVESAIEGMKQGAFDYLMKPCDINILVSKVNEAKGIKRQREEKIIQARLREITGRRD